MDVVFDCYAYIEDLIDVVYIEHLSDKFKYKEK